jgi:hypothetical protein
MRAPARQSSGYDAYDYYAHDELLPGERIGRPLARRGRKALLRGVLLLSVLGGGWALLGDQAATWPEWLMSQLASVSSQMERRLSGPAEPAARASASLPARAEPVRKPAAIDPPPSTAPETAAGPAATLVTTAPLPPAAKDSDEPAAEPLPPPTVNPADPYQVRAVAVGLHPDLSRVLLARLSATDYQNAGIAIKTALAETPDTGVFVWPRQRKPELALFQVRFVPGAAPSCRRYVVTVTKDGWLTTAPPMEKCGMQAVVRPRHG